MKTENTRKLFRGHGTQKMRKLSLEEQHSKLIPIVFPRKNVLKYFSKRSSTSSSSGRAG
jgi:hypothetical protein